MPRSAFEQVVAKVMNLTLAQRRQGFFPSSRAAGSDAERSIPPTICRTRSHATSTPTTAIVVRMDHFRQSDLRKIRPDPYLLSESLR
jgi:hypothetical protein